MIMQRNISNKAILATLFFSLLSTSVGVVASSDLLAKQAVPEAPVTEKTLETAALPPESTLANHVQTPTVALLEMVRKNSRQQAAEAAFSLATVAIERKDFAAAQLLIEEAIQLQPSHPGYTQVAASLAFTKGEFDEAEIYQVQSLELVKAAGEMDDIRVAMLMDNLGTIYVAQQRYEHATRTWQESLSIREKILGDRHPSLVPRLLDLAGVAMHDERFNETEELLKRSVQILEADATPDQTGIAAVQHTLADFYVNQQRTSEANALYQLALADWKAAPAQKRLQVAANLYELGNEYLSQLRLEEARPQFELVIKLLEHGFGADNHYVSGARTALDKLKKSNKSSPETMEVGPRVVEKALNQLFPRSQTM